jgi:hypothetical protein
MDRLEQLRGYTLEELVSEIERRQEEMRQTLARIGAGAMTPAKNAARSEAAKRRWEATKAAGHSSLRDAAQVSKTSKVSKR